MINILISEMEFTLVLKPFRAHVDAYSPEALIPT